RDASLALSAPVGIAVPLRGRRRALGTLVIEGVRVEPGSVADILARADEIGRQLAVTIENVQLLGDVIASRRQLEDVFDALTDLVVVCNADLRITRANHAFAARVSAAHADLEDRPLADFVSSELVGWLRDVAATPSTPAATTVITDDRLQGTFAVTANPVSQAAPGAPFLAVVARDITRDRQLESVQAELNNRLLQTEKLAALGQFVAGIVHELNNPLQGVLGRLELLRATGAIPPPLRREARLIYREAQRAARIVRDLLLFAGPHGIKRRRVSVRTLLNSVSALRTDALKRRGIALVIEAAPDLPPVEGNALLLQQALLNIILNAEQAIGSNGIIHVRAHAVGDSVRIEVKDSGPGIAPDVLPRVFEPFFTAKAPGEGTGLGLAVVYRIVKLHGGTVNAANADEGGAVFTITLPAHRAAGKMGAARDA
ncbi:MAG TPA: ATP-binding protein, partial [Vicinamibacterales bacterium]|nr:ATP-binding protein [Vicinamibacterales bacterium]